MELKLKELLIFMTVSAAGLPEEPQIYGPLRLIDAADKLAQILKEDAADIEVLDEFSALVENERETCMTDPKAFYAMLQEAATMLVDLV